MDEDSKDLAKIGAEAAIAPFAALIEKLFGGPAAEIGGMWQDSLQARRSIRRIKLFQKVQRTIDKAGFEPRKIPDNIWLPALQSALLQDDESLQDMWANLLASASKDGEDIYYSTFVDILKQLTGPEVRFLNALFADLEKRIDAWVALTPKEKAVERNPLSRLGSYEELFNMFYRTNFTTVSNTGFLGNQREEVEMGLENLIRIGVLIRPAFGTPFFQMDALAFRFLVACCGGPMGATMPGDARP